MILAYHSILTAYGFWLPNDPRGSWSDFVRRWELFRFGGATKVTTRRSLARVEHDVRRRVRAKQALRYPPVVFTGAQARAVGRGFAEAVAEGGYVIRACCILPEHAHVVIARHQRPIERIVGHLKAKATRRLRAEGLHPFADFAREGQAPPSPWSRRGWHVYLNSPEAVARAIRYVRQNPIREGKAPQRWRFVTPA